MVIDLKKTIVCVIGAGYVGLPLSEAFARKLKVISFDTDRIKIKQLTAKHHDRKHIFTSDPKQIARANFISICVPTPITKSKEPNMSYVREAARIVGQNMKRGAVVILESSVYPGVTEEIVKPILEKESGFKCGNNFKLAYSPERINPGDDAHNVDKITKIVAAGDQETLDVVADLYRNVTPSIYKAKNIKTAEAAKLIENIQRDLNIALVNELSIIFDKIGLDSKDVIDTAATKWNFHRYHPGLVGGYCIPVVPYFLVYKSEQMGYHPQIILAGRNINDYMPKHVVEMTIKSLNNADKKIKGSKILIMGCTYKENVSDARETPIKAVIKELKEYDVDILGFDPLLKSGKKELGIKITRKLSNLPKVDCIILAVGHDVFREIDANTLRNLMSSPPILIDIHGIFNNEEINKTGFIYKHL